jgi:hypothetical protein
MITKGRRKISGGVFGEEKVTRNIFDTLAARQEATNSVLRDGIKSNYDGIKSNQEMIMNLTKGVTKISNMVCKTGGRKKTRKTKKSRKTRRKSTRRR